MLKKLGKGLKAIATKAAETQHAGEQPPPPEEEAEKKKKEEETKKTEKETKTEKEKEKEKKEEAPKSNAATDGKSRKHDGDDAKEVDEENAKKTTMTTTTTTTKEEEEEEEGKKKKRPPVPCVRETWAPQEGSMLLSLPLELLEEVLFRTGSAHQLQGARAACVQLYHMSVDVATRHFSLPTLKNFDIIAKIGEGSFANVYQARYKGDGKIYALKVFKKSGMQQRSHLSEHVRMVPLWQQLQHPGFTPLYCAFQDEVNVYTVTSCLNGGELFYHLSRVVKFEPEAVKNFAIQMVSALCYAHDKGIVLRAVKPEDVVFDRFGRLHLTDFNMSKVIGRQRTNTFCGTPEYIAPEVLEGKLYDYSVDWWALGILLFEARTGLPPFYSPDVQLMYSKILRAELAFPAFVEGTERDFITKLLDRHVETRLQGQKVKEHPYLSGVDWAKVERGEWSPQELPYKPKVSDELDLSQFDTSFTSATNITREDIRTDPNLKQSSVYFKDFDYRQEDWGV